MQDDNKLIIDFDGTLFQPTFPHIGPCMYGALEAITELSTIGWKFVIYSCRNNPNLYNFVEDRDINLNLLNFAIKENGFPNMEIDRGRQGKPIGQWNIDDGGIEFNNNWDQILKFLDEREILSNKIYQSVVSICVGLEGCIFNKENELIQHSREALSYLIERGFRVILTTIYSNRLLIDSERKRDKKLNQIKKYLEENKIPYHCLDEGLMGKPVANYYIESNMISFNGSWEPILKRLKNYHNKN